MSPGTPAIEIDRLERRFGEITALNRVSLSIRQGEFFSLLGPSGCGKTTLLRIIGGLDVADAGTVRINGVDSNRIPAHRRPVNTVFQSYALFPHLSVRENVAFGLRMKKVPPGELEERVRKVMELVEIETLASRRPNQLSGGQKQRVALARAIVNEPTVLLLDEPLGALDLKLRKQLQVELLKLQRRLGITFVYVTHDQDEALVLSDRIAVMRDGNIEQIGNSQDLYEHPRTRFVSHRMKRSSWLLSLNAAVLYLFLYAPIVVVVVYSFNSAKRGGPWRGFTTEWYGTLLSSPEKLSAVQNTLILAVSSTAISTVLGTMLGYGLSRYRFPAKEFFSWLMYIPVMIPDIVAAVAMLMFFAMIRDRLGIFELGLPTMILAHATFQIPLIGIIVRSRLSGMDPAIEEAAHDLGASTWQTFRHVTLPLMLPGVYAGAALAFTSSIDDFVVSFFTAGPGATTLPILIYSSVKRGITPEINALATLIVVASILGTIAVTLLQQRSEMKPKRQR